MEMWSANMALKARVDAAAWLRCISAGDLQQLIAGGWAGCGSTAPAVRFYGAIDEEVEILTRYAADARTDVCYAVNDAAALAWLKVCRPALAATLVASAAVRPQGAEASRAIWKHR
jgi:hypothetical protein